MILYFSTWLRNILTYEKYSYTSGIFLYPMKYALVLFHYCPAVCMMVGWGRLATHNSRAALSSIYQIYRNISISYIPPKSHQNGQNCQFVTNNGIDGCI